MPVMTCPGCGQQIADDSAVCPFCGKPLDRPTAPAKIRMYPPAVLVVGAVGFLLLFAAIYFHSQSLVWVGIALVLVVHFTGSFNRVRIATQRKRIARHDEEPLP